MTLHISAESALALALALNGVSTPNLEQRRAVAAAVIEDLIAFLDDTDGDCDLEAGCDDEDTHDAEQLNEDGGDVLDEPHDAIDEGNDEGSSDDVGPYCSMTAEVKSAVADECAQLLSRVPQRHGPEFQVWFTGPDGSPFRFQKVA